MADNLKHGIKVSWNSHGSTAHGKVVKKLTSGSKIKDHSIRATPDDPQFLVETDGGKRAAHKPGALTQE